jgi:hypothetical protein
VSEKSASRANTTPSRRKRVPRVIRILKLLKIGSDAHRREAANSDRDESKDAAVEGEPLLGEAGFLG